MLVKRFKDFLLESKSIMDESDGYYYEVDHYDQSYFCCLRMGRVESWEYFLYKKKKLCGEFILDDISNERSIYGIDLKKYKNNLGNRIMYLAGIRSDVNGVGVMLMSKVISESKRLNYDSIVLSVCPEEHTELSKLIDFYEHFDFEIFYGKKMVRPRKRHTVLMYLRIN